MVPMTYLELVNRALVESKVTLDPLTSVNFATPPGSIMYDHFKRWCNDAYQELALSRNDWQFRKERATVTVYPRLQVAGLPGSITPGDILRTKTSGVQLTVIEVHIFENIEQPNNGAEVTISFLYDDPSQAADIILGEELEEINPTPTALVGYVKGWGFYDFRELLPVSLQIDPESVYLNKTVQDSFDEGDLNSYPVAFLPWETFDTKYAYRYIDMYYGAARAIAQTPQGSYELYPRLDKAYLLSFDYTRDFEPLTTWDSIPDILPPEYHQYLMWKTVMEYADFDGNAKVFARAKKHIDQYAYWYDRDNLPRPTMIQDRFRISNGVW